MINLDTFKNIFKKVSVRRRVPDRRLMHPNREWGIGLLLLACILVVGGIYASFVFKQYSTIDVSTENVEVETVRYNRADALKALEIYNEKQSNYDSLLMEQPTPVFTEENGGIFDQETTSDEDILNTDTNEIETESDVIPEEPPAVDGSDVTDVSELEI